MIQPSISPEEMHQKGVEIDIPTLVEEPQIYILGRSSNSLDDQRQFIECMRECLLHMDKVLHTQAGTPVHDHVRFFHGDGPAMQFEAGNKIGGHYSCVGCEARSSRFDDLAYCFHAHHPTLTERQEFILRGEAWKHSQINPLNKLRVTELRRELPMHGISTTGKKEATIRKRA